MTKPEPQGLLRLIALAALPLALAAPAQAQGLRGSFDALPGADNAFSPYALGPAPSSAFGLPEPLAGEEEQVQTDEDASPPPLVEPEPRQRRRRARADDNPYEQLGLRAGAFLIKPSVDVVGGYDTNPANREDPEGSWFWRTRGRIDLESDWSRHAFRGRIEAGYRAYDEFPERDAPDYSADAALRLDVRRDLRVDMAVRGEITSETRGDPDLIGSGSTEQNHRYTGSAGVTWKPNRLAVSLSGQGDRREFGDPGLADNDYTEYDMKLRTGYELQEGLEPFVEASVNERVYDQRINDGGLAHDSWGFRTYAGARVEPNGVWAFEGKMGYGHQEIEDASVGDLNGLVASGTLIWKPSVLTELRLTAERDFSASTSTSSGMNEAWRVDASFTHEFRRWLILTGGARFEEREYPNSTRSERQFDADLELEYKFNRNLSGLARVVYENFDSSRPGDDFEAAVFTVGLRAQR